METPTRARDKVLGLVGTLNDGFMDLRHNEATVFSSPSASSCASIRDRTALDEQYLSKGQLKLGIAVQGNTLTVTVQEASGLKSQWRPKCMAYVQVQICPDDKVTSRSQTKVAMETNNPVFNHTMKFPLDSSDPKKRVMISAWHSDPVKNCSEFIGCLSFGLAHLVAKCRRQQPEGVSGWYYLLSAEIGHRKHILARPAEVVAANDQQEEQDKENSDKYQRLTFTLKHRQPGYGFTVRGPHPIRVGRIKAGGPAHSSGLYKGDVITALNGDSVNGRDMQEVAEIVRKSEGQCIVDVLRSRVAKQPKLSNIIDDSCIGSFQLNFEKHPSTRSLYQGNTDSCDGFIKKTTSFESSPKCEINSVGKKLKRKSICDDVQECSSYKQTKTDDINNCDQNQNLFNEGLFCKPCSKSMFSRDSGCSEVIAQQKLTNHNCEHIKVISNRLDARSTESNLLSKYQKWNPEMSAITTASSHMHSLVDSVLSTDSTQSLLDQAVNQTSDSTVCCSSLLVNTAELGHHDSHRHTDSLCTLQDTFSSYQSSDDASRLRPSSPTCSLVDESRLGDMTDFDNLSMLSGCSVASEQRLKRDLNVRTLVKCEEQFVREMARGIQTYSRPLRFCVLTSAQTEVLFQNVEKLVAMSQYNLSKLVDQQYSAEHTLNGTTNHGHITTDQVGHQYLATTSLLCESYTSYISGLPAAVKILAKLRQYPEFEHLLQKQRSKCDLDILDFLQQPVMHFEFLRRGFQDILLHTNVEDDDFCQLEQICQEFDEAACNIML